MSSVEKSLRYSMIIEWSDEDDAFVVTVPELPGCRTHGSTYEEAVKRGQEAMELWIEDALADDDPIPQPGGFSGWSPFARSQGPISVTQGTDPGN